MLNNRRIFLKNAAIGTLTSAVALPHTAVQNPFDGIAAGPHAFDVRQFGAAGDGHTNDAPAVNRAIAATSASGGGTLRFPGVSDFRALACRGIKDVELGQAQRTVL